MNKKCRYGNKCHYQHPIVEDREQVIQRVPTPSPQVQSSNNVNYSNSVSNASNAHNEQSFLYVTQPQGPPPGPQLTQEQIMMGLMSQIMPLAETESFLVQTVYLCGSHIKILLIMIITSITNRI